MSRRLGYHPEAPDDINEAIAWYEQQKPALAQQFVMELRDHLDAIAANPELYAVEYRGVRAAPMRRFPYIVYYRIEAKRVVVGAIQHGRRHPRAWRRRI